MKRVFSAVESMLRKSQKRKKLQSPKVTNILQRLSSFKEIAVDILDFLDDSKDEIETVAKAVKKLPKQKRNLKRRLK
jgi:hypothetical protein